MITQIFAAVMCGFLDRIRGDSFDLGSREWGSKTIDAAVYGFMLAIALGSGEQWTYLLFAALWVAGASFGWGEPLGAALLGRRMNPSQLESWQFGIFKTNIWAALALRGLIWGLPPSLLAVFDPRYLMCLSMVLIFPLAVLVGKDWEKQELIRGWMIGATALVVGLFV